MATCVDCGDYFNKPPEKRYLVRRYSCYVKWKDYCDSYDPDYIETPDIQEVDKYGVQQYIRELLQLCHPDKHNGSKTADKITAWLLKIPRK